MIEQIREQKPLDIPPFQLQQLISDVNNGTETGRLEIRCAQALGSEIYVGCTNGELIRFALQADEPEKLESYTIISRQTLTLDKPIDEIVLIPNLSRALVLSDHQIHFYTIPSLDSYPIKPIRHVVTFAVDDHHLKRPQPGSAAGLSIPVEPVEFCVIKRASIAMFTLKDRLFYTKEIPLPSGAVLAKRAGKSMCIADKQFYSIVDLENASLFPVLPLSQAYDEVPFVVKPSITVINSNEFLIVSWTGASSLGLFITNEGDPVRGTLQWPSHPEALNLDYPHITSLLPNGTIEVHNVETQSIVQVIGAPPLLSPPTKSTSPVKPSSGHTRSTSSGSASRSIETPTVKRLGIVSSVSGYLVPSVQRSDKMKMVPFKLIRTSS